MRKIENDIEFYNHLIFGKISNNLDIPLPIVHELQKLLGQGNIFLILRNELK